MYTKDISFLSKDDLHRFQSVIESLTDEVTKLSSNPKHIILKNKEAQELLGISPKTLIKYRNEGWIKYSKVGGEVFFTLKDILEMLENHSVQSIY